jgi:hypothetical protein
MLRQPASWKRRTDFGPAFITNACASVEANRAIGSQPALGQALTVILDAGRNSLHRERVRSDGNVRVGTSKQEEYTMKAEETESFRDTSSTDIAELVVAELRARRKHVQHLISLVNEEAGREYEAVHGVRAASTARCCGSARPKCSHCPAAARHLVSNSRSNRLKKHNLPA